MSPLSLYKWFRLATAAADAAIFYFCAYLAIHIRAYMGDATLTDSNIEAMSNVLPFICLVGVFLLYVYGLYRQPERAASDVIYSVLLTVLALAVTTMALSFFLRSFAYPRLVIAIGSALQFVLLTGWRLLAMRVARALHGRQTVLVVGHGAGVAGIAHKIQSSQGRLFEIKHLFDLDRQEYKTLRRLIKEVEHVFVCPDVTAPERQKIFSYCMAMDTTIFIIPDLFDISVKNAVLQTFDDAPVFRIGQLKLTWEQRAVKRLFDLLLSAVVLTLTAPLMLLCGLAIRLTSPGPAIFTQERITEGNRVFKVYKLRTMYLDAEDKTGPVLAAENDTRVTRVGAFLRATRLDELPQFLNVLRGEMSVVGPRPERPFFIEQFKKELPGYDYRAAVKAGITGYAQVMGKYTTDPSDKLRFDLWYIKNYSLWMDLTLVVQTLRLFFARDAAKGVTNTPT